MGLAVVGKQSLDEMEKTVVELFSGKIKKILIFFKLFCIDQNNQNVANSNISFYVLN